MKCETYITKSAGQTQKLGELFAKEILTRPLPVRQRANGVGARNSLQNKAVVLGLQGDLGGGKTTFLQGFAKGLGIKEKILSPTFVIMKRFAILQNPSRYNRRSSIITGKSFCYFYHFDCYRVDKPEEILKFGFEEIISNPENIVAIEWSEKLKTALPKKIIRIKFKFIDKQTRELTF